MEILKIKMHDHDPEVRNKTGRLIAGVISTVAQFASKVGDQQIQKDHNEALQQLMENIREESKRRTIDVIPNTSG